MVEDIVLESPAAAASVLNPPLEASRRVDYEFTLRPRLSSYSVQFRIINGCFVEAEKRDKKGNLVASTCFHLGLLEPQPKTCRSTAWMTFLGALLSGIAAAVMAYVVQDWVLVSATAVLSLSLFAVHYCSYRKQTEFCSRSGKIPLLSLSHRCKNRAELKQFIGKLKQSIENNTLPASSLYFAEETRWHRTLKEQGWISDDDYQKARARIMKQFNRKAS
jgi:hypothetical protein